MAFQFGSILTILFKCFFPFFQNIKQVKKHVKNSTFKKVALFLSFIFVSTVFFVLNLLVSGIDGLL